MKIPNLIANLRNAYKAKQSKTLIINSKTNLIFLDILKSHKFILGYSTKEKNKVEVYLKYTSNKSCIFNILNLDKTTTPLYISASDLWKLEKDIGYLILNTPKGIITHKRALKKGVGGKALAYII